MSYDSRIILGSQNFDLTSAMNAGRDLAMQQKAFDQQNALAELFKTQGAGIMAGDQNALAQLAQYDPAAALGIQSQHQSMAYATEDQQHQRETARREAENYAKTISAEQAAAEAAQIESGVKRALAAPDAATFDAMMTEMGMADMVGQFDNRQALAADYMTVAEVLKMNAGPEQTSSQRDYQFYSTQESEAGRKPLSFNEWDLQGKKAGATSVSTTVGLPGEDPPAGDALRASITDADTMLSMIEAIDTSKALPKVTGAIEGGGGNNVDDMNAVQRAWYGDDGLALIQSIGQLQGNAWLGARALLKGGGQITDYESKKAEGAMARLSRAQGTKEFKAALADLKAALKDGLEKLKAAQGAADVPAPDAEGDGIPTWNQEKGVWE